MANAMQSLCGAAAIAAAVLPSQAFAQALAQAMPPLSSCTAETKVPACDAVRGDRADGWHAQSRAEVMAPHAMVAASRPLAAQGGLQIMRAGGNAIDAAVATAAVLNLVEPMMTGVAGDLFAII
jgi:gamma-glutamyltranspeptidase/glutathione hydrolase